MQLVLLVGAAFVLVVAQLVERKLMRPSRRRTAFVIWTLNSSKLMLGQVCTAIVQLIGSGILLRDSNALGQSTVTQAADQCVWSVAVVFLNTIFGMPLSVRHPLCWNPNPSILLYALLWTRSTLESEYSKSLGVL